MNAQHKFIKEKLGLDSFFVEKTKALKCFSYLAEFRYKFEETLNYNYSIKTKVVHYDGGTIIENRIVDRERAQTTMLEIEYPFDKACRIASLELSNNENDIIALNKRTTIFIDGEVFHLIKGDPSKLWKLDQAKNDIMSIVEDVFLPPKSPLCIV